MNKPNFDCFYCQDLKRLERSRKIRTRLLVGGAICNFCRTYNDPLWLIKYQKQELFFCCCCTWWQFPHSETEKAAEEE